MDKYAIIYEDCFLWYWLQDFPPCSRALPQQHFCQVIAVAEPRE